MNALFELIGDNPPTALIIGGIFMLVLSSFTGLVDPSATTFLRQSGWDLIFLGILLNVGWLIIQNI